MNLSGKDAGGHEVTSVEASIDFNELLERVGGDAEFLQELFDIFLDNSTDLLNQIKQHIEENDHEALARAAHTLKGSVSNFTPTGPVFEMARSLEFMGKEKNLDQAPESYDELAEKLDSLHATIKQFGNNIA
ncbi:MAG: Hpt domain-containing protein [Deferribacteres bacterium]|nr:Hpt domain-containing protein [candidate division KSB1 bacterium]MCB9500534.1 Hpt domain-containing protein [Deferribacteres bacterium]